MKILIDSKAEEYIKKASKDKDITINLFEASNCWVPIVEPSVEMGRPEDESLYNLYNISNIKVYCIRELRAKNGEIIIKMRNFFWSKYLYVEGYNI